MAGLPAAGPRTTGRRTAGLLAGGLPTAGPPSAGPPTAGPRPAGARTVGRLAVGLLAVGLLAAGLLVAPAGTATAGEPVPPTPPPATGVAPEGERPGPAPGVRAPERCTVPGPADAEPVGPTPAQRLRLAEAHRIATGAGVLVAVVDTGVDPHERLAGRLRGGGDYLTGGDGLDDCDGHGTAVAGIVAAAPAPGDDVVGIAPGATLLAIRQSSPSFTVPAAGGGTRPAGDVAGLAEAVVLAVRAGADVVNISEAVCLAPERAATEGVGLQAALRLAAEADVVVVAAAGNVGTGSCVEPDGSGAGQVSLPGWYDGIVAVGAAGPDDAPAPFTVRGPWVDLAAPGTGLRSLAVGGGVTAASMTGTSFAAPWVAGLAALLRERFPGLSAAQVVERMTATARRPAGGHDPSLGAGVIDPVAALTAEPAAGTSTSARGPVLAGTVPAAPPATAPPVDAALGLLLAAAAGAAALLRRPVSRAGARPPSAPPG